MPECPQFRIDVQDTKLPPLGEAEAASLTSFFSEVVVDADGDVEAVLVEVASDASNT